MNVKLPLGVDNFEKLRNGNYYYVDKTALVRSILLDRCEVTLITRPRRFGKTLTMSMMDDFFDISRDSSARFAGLEIAKDTVLCEEWRNKWPVIFLTLKSVQGMSFDSAYEMLVVLIAELCKKYAFLDESERVDPDDREIWKQLKTQKANRANLKSSLKMLTRMLHAYYGKQVIVLIDEYDVPLAKAHEHGYYQEMLDVIRAMLDASLKTNEHLKFAILTGCLKISQESIFTGLNNVVANTITTEKLDENIGFTEKEVKELFETIGFSERLDEVKRWYDGYQFGAVDIYCPWDVINYADELQKNPKAVPKSYWAATSHNRIIYKLFEYTDVDVTPKFEALLAGKTISEEITEDLTYDTMEASERNLWSLLYMTGYLTRGKNSSIEDLGVRNEIIHSETHPVRHKKVVLRIPNEEIRFIFEGVILGWFQNMSKNSILTKYIAQNIIKIVTI